MKAKLLLAEARRLYPGSTIIDIVGLRADESHRRRKRAVFAPNEQLTAKRAGTRGFTWLPIHNWPKAAAFEICAAHGYTPSLAYRHGAARHSCVFCPLATSNDWSAAIRLPHNLTAYRRLCRLELASAFSFDPTRWLVDIAPSVHDIAPADITAAKERARQRRETEATIPDHLRYEDGWPSIMPTPAEADRLASIRRAIAGLYDLSVSCLDGEAVLARYSALIAARDSRLGPARHPAKPLQFALL